jgi:6-phosphogluconolactonase
MSGPHVLVTVDDASAAARATAELVITAAVDAVQKRGVFHFCTTGGSTPAALYAVLREEANVHRMPWSSTEIWFGDDRHVPRTSPLSNLAAIDSVLLTPSSGGAPSPISPRAVHPWPTDEEGARAVDSYLSAAQSAGVLHTSAGVPIFDLLLIGIGGDAHCLSVFPGSPLTATDAPAAAAVPAPTHIEPHVPRLTFSLGLLSAARAVCATVVGEGKSAALARILEGEGSTSELPAKAALLPTATWIVDRAAASGLHAATER